MPEQVRVRITRMAMTAQYGTLNAGTVLHTSPEFAKHLVEDCDAAEYIQTPAPETPAPETPKKRAKPKTAAGN